PTKSEIKFENEQEIRPLLVAAVRASLGKNAAVPSIDFSTAPVEVDPLMPGEEIHDIDTGLTPGYNPFEFRTPPGLQPLDNEESGSGFSSSGAGLSTAARFRGARPSAKNWDDLYADFVKSKEENVAQDLNVQPDPQLPDMQPSAFTPICIQYALKYILTATSEGILIIDQHRAHVKILYEEIMERVSLSAQPSQRVFFPESVTLDQAQCMALAEVEKELRSLGFELEKESPVSDSYLIVSVPVMDKNISPSEMVMRILDSVRDDSSEYGRDDNAAESMLSRMALVMARASAIVRGHRLSQEEMESLVSRLFRLPDPSLTPGGNLIYHVLDESRIAALLH
ncbi:MAG: hypothetical protein K2F64_03620, partial [Muribaculaceae bacterium]|nr:hypothetical protein [Muribaculaceae bacterium]